MPRQKISAVAFCFLVTSFSFVAAADEPAPAGKVAAPATVPYSGVQHLADNVTLATLENGLTVIVQENHSAPVATVRCYVKNTGGAFEGKYLGAGLSHVLEHVVAGGTTTHRTEKQIEKIIASFGGVTNAYTTNDHTTFYIDCPAKNAMTAIELVADSMQHITFESKEFERELKVVRRELADDEDDRGHVLADQLDLTVYSTSPARYPVIGFLQVLNGTTNQTIIDFYHERYVPNNQIFVVVGDVNTQEVLDHVARQWVGTPRGRETYVALPEEPEQVSPRQRVREMEGTDYDFALAWPTVTLSSRDMYALDLAAYILGEGESSRLVRRLRYEVPTPLVQSVAAYSSTPHFVRGYFAVTASAEKDKWQDAEKEILRMVAQLRDEEVSPAELARAKKQKAAELVYQHQTVQEQAESLGLSYLAAVDPLFDSHYTEQIQKVTAAEIQEVARKYFVPSRLNRVIIAPPGGAPKGAAIENESAAGKVRLERLPNGLRVLIKRVPNLPLVNIQAHVRGGSFTDGYRLAGKAELLAALMDKGTRPARGYPGASAEQVAAFFDSVGGQLSFSAGRFTFSGNATCLKEDFPKAAELFADSLLYPALPEDQFRRAQSSLLDAIDNRSADASAEVASLFLDSLPTASPYHINPEGQVDTVKHITVEQLRQLHAEWFRPGDTVVSVYGDIDPDAAMEMVKKHFGDLPSSERQMQHFPAGGNAIAESKTVHKETSKGTAMLMLGYPCEGIYDQKDHAAMTVLRAILNGYSTPGGWLHNELRGAGLIYYVFTREMTGPVPGYFVITSQTRPETLKEVIDRIRRNLDRAKEGKISDDEFRLAIDQIIGLHAQENVTVGEQAATAGLDELYGLGYDYDAKFDDQIRAVTKDDVVRAAKKYLTNSVLVTTAPK